HRTAAADVTDLRVLRLQLRQPVDEDLTDVLGIGDHAVLFVGGDRAEGRGTGDGVAAVGSAEPAGSDRVHDVRATGYRRQRQPTGDALGRGDEIGDDALPFGGEHLPGAGEAGLDLVGDEDDALLAGVVDQRRQEALGRNNEAALALDGLDDDRGDVFGA